MVTAQHGPQTQILLVSAMDSEFEKRLLRQQPLSRTPSSPSRGPGGSGHKSDTMSSVRIAFLSRSPNINLENISAPDGPQADHAGELASEGAIRRQIHTEQGGQQLASQLQHDPGEADRDYDYHCQ